MEINSMLFSPEHALRIAADAVGRHAESTDMAVGIITGIAAAIEEWNRLTTAPAASPVDTHEESKDKTPAVVRPRAVAAAHGG